MNKEMIKSYEADLDVFCGLAASVQIDCDKQENAAWVGIYQAVKHAFELAAQQMMSRLEDLCPTEYWQGSIHNRELFIDRKIIDAIEEKIDHEQKTQPLS